MPYICIYCELKNGTHPNATILDKDMDDELLDYLKAKLKPEYKSELKYWEAPDSPGVVLTQLEQKGYTLVSSCCNNLFITWTLKKQP